MRRQSILCLIVILAVAVGCKRQYPSRPASLAAYTATPLISHTFTVSARNSFGPGPASAVSNSIYPGTAPSVAPSAVTAVAGNAQAIVTYNVRDLVRGELTWPNLQILTPAQYLEQQP